MKQKKLKALREERNRLYDRIPQRYRHQTVSFYMDYDIESEVEALRIEAEHPEEYWLELDESSKVLNKMLADMLKLNLKEKKV